MHNSKRGGFYLCLAKELGERRIIEIIFDCLERMPNIPFPLGDDASAFDINHERVVVVTTDMLVGKTDVPPQMNFWQAARKAVVMNISDLAAKGVKPIGVLTAIGCPNDLTKKDIEQIGKGLNDGAREYGAYVIGGDTNEASDLIISCTAFGVCRKNLFMGRSGAKPGDLIATTGFFGKSMSGLKILLNNFSLPPEIGKALVDAVFMPYARVTEGLVLAKTRAVTASIDSSDGLAWSLHELSKASKVGFLIDTLPIAQEVKKFAEIHDLDPIELALYGGEEYELVITVKPKLWKKVEEAMKHVETQITKIGLVTKKLDLIFETMDKPIYIEARGWEHFKTTLHQNTNVS